MADGKLQGTVIDIRSNEPLEGVSIQVDGGASSDSGQDGKWGPMDVPAGTHNVTASKEQFDDGVYEGIVVLEGETTELSFGLHAASDE